MPPPNEPCLPSGDSRADVGVALLVMRGIKLGLGCVSLGSSGIGSAEFNGFGISSCGVGVWALGKVGMGGGCIILLRCCRFASVGLTVLAPSPEARPDASDCRLLPDEEGVCALFWLAFEAGLPFEGVFGSCWSRGGGCRLLTLFCRDCVVAVSVERRGISGPADVEGWMVVRLALLKLLVRASAGFVLGSEVGICCPLLPFIILVSRPGPTDFRGGFAAGPGGGGPEVIED